MAKHADRALPRALPVALEPWALDAAAELEGIRSSVAAEVGYAPDLVVDVIVRDPMSEANGFALPLGTGPRMELWATAPDAASVIGHYDRWSRLLVTHEDAHLVHLLRPSRSPLERALSAATGPRSDHLEGAAVGDRGLRDGRGGPPHAVRTPKR
jgi:hypothetical protein